MTDISSWLAVLGLSRYAPRFVAEEVDLDALAHLREEDLKELGLPLGPRRKIMAAIASGIDSPPPRGAGTCDPSRARHISPGDLARQAMASPAGMDGERKLISVLFADLRGSTDLIQDLDAMIDAVQYFSGTVNRVQGDGIMALFGAPIAHEDHALRACLAGLRMRDAISALKDDALALRVGIHSGEAVVRTIRNDLTEEYEADGPAVHLAARIEQMAAAGTVRTTRDTWRLVDGHVDARNLGPVPVKGFTDPVTQYELLMPSSAASRWEGRMRHGLSRFVGRERELAVLQEAATVAATGRGQVVALVGEAGMGKSRLLHEFLASAAMKTWTLRVLALCEAADGDRARARSRINAARSLALSQAARPEVAHAELALARLSAELDESDAATSWALSTSEAYEAMGMTRWVPQARALATVSSSG